MASRHLLQMLIALFGLAISCETSEAAKRVAIPPPRFPFKIDPMTPLAELLPPAPELTPKAPGILNEDLARVPELMFAKPLAKDLEFFKSQEETAHRMAKINHLNGKNTDGFMNAFLAKRGDLRGLPFLLGKDCRTEEKQAAVFRDTVRVVRLHLENAQTDEPPKGTFFLPTEQKTAELFWKAIAKIKFGTPKGAEESETVLPHPKKVLEPALVAVLMQMITPMSEPYRLGLIEYLKTNKHADATVALAKLALYSPEDNVREAAIDGLKARDVKDYVESLLAGFRYPLPVVSQRAAEALVKTRNKAALDGLVLVLEQADPRAPFTKQTEGKKISFVREIVRVNHHHNCLLCHAPANTDDFPQKSALSAPVPQPGQPLPSVFQGYGSRQSPDIFVRVDMTYLRQDFSVMMKVENAKPWPEMQRYDFFVRTREASPAEATDMAKTLAQKTPPNHAAAQRALRELTGQAPATPTPEAWREILKSAASQR